MQPQQESNELYKIERRYTSYGGLIALGVEIENRQLLAPIKEKVRIKQKVIRDSPTDKLTDALIGMLAGARGLVETNKKVRPDKTLQRSFGRQRCAEQSVISDTLNACGAENVAQLKEAMQLMYRQQSQGYAHNYDTEWQLLDVDMSGQPCGKKAEFATKGYFAKQRNRRGRQLGRVMASWYDEVVIDQLYAGTVQLPKVLQELVEAAARVLDLDERRRQRTIVRTDGHGGSLEDVNWLLLQGYHIHTKDYSGTRASTLATSVTEWFDDPKVAQRQFGLVTSTADEYVDIVHRIAVRTPKKNGTWAVAVLLSSLSPHEATYLAGFDPPDLLSEADILAAYVHFYDLRGGWR